MQQLTDDPLVLPTVASPTPADPLTEVLRRGARQLLAQAVEAEVADFIHDRRDVLDEALGHKASVPTVWRETRKQGLRLKKRPSTPPSRTGPT